MVARLLAVAVLWVVAGGGMAQEQTDKDAEITRLQNKLAILTAENSIAVAQYGAAIKGKSGEIANADKLSGMVYQHLPWATQAVGNALGKALNNGSCDRTTVLSGTGMSGKLVSAISFTMELRRLDKDITEAGSQQVVDIQAVPAIMSAVGGAVALASLLKSDYAVHSTEMAVDMDWLIASILAGDNNLASERFPDRKQVDPYIAKVNEVKTAADLLTDSPKKDALVKRADALVTALYKPDSDGTLPIVTAALLSPINSKSDRCLAIVIGAKAAPILLTKETIFGKGGRAFVYLPVQASIIQFHSNGRPIKMECRVATVSAKIKLSDLTRATGENVVPWFGKKADYVKAEKCSLGAPVEPEAPDAPVQSGAAG